MHRMKGSVAGELKMSVEREELGLGADEDFLAGCIEAIGSGSEEDESAFEPREERQNELLEFAGISGDGEDDGHGPVGPGADLAGGRQGKVGRPGLKFER